MRQNLRGARTVCEGVSPGGCPRGVPVLGGSRRGGDCVGVPAGGGAQERAAQSAADAARSLWPVS